jgi:hypothetical protein
MEGVDLVLRSKEPSSPKQTGRGSFPLWSALLDLEATGAESSAITRSTASLSVRRWCS